MARGKTSRGGKSKIGQRRRFASTSTAVDANDDCRLMDEKLSSIDYHWKSFSHAAKTFLLGQPDKLTLRKFLDFFSQPDEAAFASMSISAGSAHTLAYDYFNIGAIKNAKVIVLLCADNSCCNIAWLALF